MKKIIVQCSVCGSQFIKEDMGWHHGDAVPHCPRCGEHDMIFFSHIEKGAGVDKKE